MIRSINSGLLLRIVFLFILGFSIVNSLFTILIIHFFSFLTRRTKNFFSFSFLLTPKTIRLHTTQPFAASRFSCLDAQKKTRMIRVLINKRKTKSIYARPT